MKLNYLGPLTLVCIMSGCSFYDVATLATDAAFGTGVFSDEDRNTAEWNGLWDPDTSDCIRYEKELRQALRGLDTTDYTQDSVVLPTGEKYLLNKPPASDTPLPGPTATCLARSSE